MTRHLIRIAALCGFIGLLSPLGRALGQSPELIVETDSKSIYEGESLLYRVTLNHVEQPNPPILDGFDDFDVESLGEQSLNSQQITIINGVRREVIRRGQQYNYRLTPRRIGTLTIPAPKAKVDNQDLLGNPVTIQVTAPEPQDIVLLFHSVNQQSVYPTQPFTITLTISVKALPEAVRDRDPMSVQPQPPELSVPWFEDERIPAGIEAESGWREILEPLISRRGVGFQMNSIRNSSLLSMFERDAIGFHPKPTRTVRKNSSGNDEDYWDYVFQRTFIPKKTGEYNFGPISLKGTFCTSVVRGKLKGEEIYAVAKSLSVSVREVPLAGRPDTFIGAVGTFNISSELSPTTANVGDPMTLTLSLTGKGTLSDARPPEIAKLPGIDGSFRTYDATSETRGDTRRFTYSLRPLQTNIETFPSIPVAYFDVDKGAYVTVATDPVPLTIKEAETLNDAQIVASQSSNAPQGSDLQASANGVFANDTNLSHLRNEAVAPQMWLTSWLGMVGIYGVAAILTAMIRRRLANPSLLRRRGAATKAKAALAEARRLRETDRLRETSDQLRRAVVGWIADHFDLPSQGLTTTDVDRQLEDAAVATDVRDATQRFLQACDATRYGAAGDDVATLEREATSLIQRLQESLSGARGLTKIVNVSLLLALFGITSGCGNGAGATVVAEFQEAERSFAEAKNTEDFGRVASQYQQILDGGFISGTVLFNQANAFMRAGEVGRAIAAYRQAKRLRPRDPYLDANLKNALQSVVGGAQQKPESGLMGYIFFWQHWLSFREKCIVLTILLAFTLVAAFAYQLTSQLWLFRTSCSIAILLVPVALSVVRDWQQQRALHGVLVTEPTVARKGNSSNYEPAFTKPLPVGTEFHVVERRDDWLHVDLEGLGEGWIPERATVVY